VKQTKLEYIIKDAFITIIIDVLGAVPMSNGPPVASRLKSARRLALPIKANRKPGMPAKAASKTADFTIGQRVLFRVRVRPALWLSGSVIGGPRSKQGRA
jgi:hypothetical protein